MIEKSTLYIVMVAITLEIIVKFVMQNWMKLSFVLVGAGLTFDGDRQGHDDYED